MEIVIGRGLDIVQFGWTEPQVIEALGQPDKVYDCGGNKRFQFFDLQIELQFDPDLENKLDWIEVKNADAIFLGRKLLGKTLETVLPIVSAAMPEVSEHDDYGGFESYFYDDHQVELQFELNRLHSINFGHLWLDDNDTPDWPQ